MLRSRLFFLTLAVLGTGQLIHGCGSETTESNGDDSGDGGDSGAAGSSTGATSQGGSQPVGGSSGASFGGATSGTSGASGASGAQTGGNGGMGAGAGAGAGAEGGSGAGAGVAGEGGGGAGGAGTGGSGAGRAGAGGAPTMCYPDADAMDMCGPRGASCLCCPLGGAAETCICTTQCTTSDDCTDPSRPTCNIDPMFTERGICTPEGFVCRWGSRCAAPNTPIATPSGERPIAELRVGDLVYSVEGRAVVVVPIRAVQRLPVTSAHRVSRVTLEGGAVLEISALHPTADARSFGDLDAGDELGGLLVENVVQAAPYAYSFTHDILPDSSSGAYFAAGALIGSTLFE